MILKTYAHQLCFLFPFLVSSIHISHIDVPRYHLAGDDLYLNCSYEHARGKPDPLYSVKWYRGVEHFYEYIPTRDDQLKAFPFPGLKVNLQKSSGSSVVLTQVDEKTSGVFRCEVMGDKPLFETDSANANLTIVEPPLRGPRIEGIENESQVRIGDRLSVRCSIGDSRPPANLTWILNGRHSDVTKDSMRIRTADPWGQPLIETTLDLQLGQSSFRKGVLYIECLAELFDVYRQSHKITLLDIDRPQPAGIDWWFSSGSDRSSHFYPTIGLGLLALWRLFQSK